MNSPITFGTESNNQIDTDILKMKKLDNFYFDFYKSLKTENLSTLQVKRRTVVNLKSSKDIPELSPLISHTFKSVRDY